VLKRFLSFLFILLLCVSCTSQPSKVPSSADLVPAFLVQTVALYDQGKQSMKCTGVWVDSTKILTAAHCVDPEEMTFYSTWAEHTDVGVPPTKMHVSVLLKYDPEHDLAVLETFGDTPFHSTASVALKAPRIGEDVHSMGHTKGLAWSYKHGWVSQYRKPEFLGADEMVGPWMQVSLPGSNGDSGGGLFDEHGELIGIASFMSTQAPNAIFYSHVGTIRALLAKP
jgi:serine protease Do